VSYVANATEALRKLGHAPCIISADSDPAALTPDVYPLDWKARSGLTRLREALRFRINPRMAHRQRYSRALVLAARKAIRERGAELLEMEESFGLIQLVKPQLPIPILTKLHGPHFLNGPVLGVPADASFRQRVRTEGFGIAAADGVSAPSRDVLERTRAFYGMPLAEAQVIPYPAPNVPPEQRWTLEECDRSRLLFVGRFDRHKGGDVVIDAFNRVARRFPQIRLWFAGPADGPLVDDNGRRWTRAEYLSERAPEISQRIDWLGRQSNSALAELRRKAFLTIVSSRYETFGMVVLEAMAYGCPLVATRAGGIIELVEHGSNGILVSSGNPDELASALTALLEAPEMAAKLSRRAAEDAVSRFNSEAIARQSIAFYQTVLDRSAGRSD
jgi:glycosyltransferase involved in cell wall biosynthesis